MTSKNSGNCAATDCDKGAKATGLCWTHYGRVRKTGSAGSGEIREYRKEAVIGYHRMHQLVRSLRGPAVDRMCVDCGTPAADWSLMHDCDEIVIDSKLGFTYSLAIWAYEPRCRKCHKRYDRDSNYWVNHK